MNQYQIHIPPYYINRRHRRESLDLRGVTLHSCGEFQIQEVEDGLQKYWIYYQDQPDEIVVDDICVFRSLITGEEIKPTGPAWCAGRTEYLSKYTINPDPGARFWIPVFESGLDKPKIYTEIEYERNRKVVFCD